MVPGHPVILRTVRTDRSMIRTPRAEARRRREEARGGASSMSYSGMSGSPALAQALMQDAQVLNIDALVPPSLSLPPNHNWRMRASDFLAWVKGAT